MIRTSLIISTYNWPEALIICLKSVATQNILPDEIIVADDGSGEETKKIIDQYIEISKVTVKHVWQEDNGFRLARIRNLAIKSSAGDYLIFIDGDIILHPNFIKDHLNTLTINKFVSGSRVLLSKKESESRLGTERTKFFFPFYDAKNKLNGLRNAYLSKLFSKSNSGIYNLRGCNMAFWKKDIYEVNGFDERFTGWGREDSDIAFRLMQAGKTKFKLKFSAIQYHLFHNEKDRSLFGRNNKVLNETISDKSIKAKIGLNEIY